MFGQSRMESSLSFQYIIFSFFIMSIKFLLPCLQVWHVMARKICASLPTSKHKSLFSFKLRTKHLHELLSQAQTISFFYFLRRSQQYLTYYRFKYLWNQQQEYTFSKHNLLLVLRYLTWPLFSTAPSYIWEFIIRY